jgi:amino acid adenylation domain-containing protein
MTYRHLLHRLLESSAERFPERAAVIDRDRRVTYAELDAVANRLAHLLAEAGIKQGNRVGIYMDKSLEAVEAIYGILKAGAVYVPLDARAPTARLAYIARDCGIECLITAREMSGKWAGLVSEGAPLRHLVVLNSSHQDWDTPAGVGVFSTEALQAMPAERPAISNIDLDLAYILYTSGSTGVPKGVMLSHRNGLAFVEWAVDEVSVGPEDRLSSHAPFHFDLSIFDVFATSRAGASVSLVPPHISVFPIELARFIREHEITVWYSVPSILTMLTEHGSLQQGDLPSLRVLVFAGEVFPTKYLSRLMRLLPHARFYNWYGPTETNVCTSYQVPEPPEELDTDIPIGSAIANDQTLVVTEDGRLAEPGEVGELMVRGATVMQGYWGDAEKTAQRLVSNPFPVNVGDLVFRTGDLVQELPSGDYKFLGRRDHQIKSRGYRIELGEIESALNAHPEVVECAVIAIPDEMISNRIKAYVVKRGDQQQQDLIAFCAQHLPRYMIPELFEFREALPKTSTGKIDRQSLTAQELSPATPPSKTGSRL